METTCRTGADSTTRRSFAVRLKWIVSNLKAHKAGPGTWERPARHEPGRVPGRAVTARRWPAPRHRAGPLHAFGPISALAFEQDSCPCSPLCSGFPLPVPLQLRRSWRCRGAGLLKPSGLSATQKDSFRLLFVTSTERNASSSNIADYNSFVQGRAAAGDSLIRSFSSKFRVVGSTSSVHARDNTETTYTSSDKGPPIGWLNGAKAADNYEDFYDGSWDNENATNEFGNAQRAGCFGGSRQTLWTGTRNDGTGDFSSALGGFSTSSRTGAPACASGSPLYFSLSTSARTPNAFMPSPRSSS